MTGFYMKYNIGLKWVNKVHRTNKTCINSHLYSLGIISGKKDLIWSPVIEVILKKPKAAPWKILKIHLTILQKFSVKSFFVSVQSYQWFKFQTYLSTEFNMSWKWCFTVSRSKVPFPRSHLPITNTSTYWHN